jgi:DNA-binding PadR family transcriptional regulator
MATSSVVCLQVEEGSLYPALQRMLIKGWVTAKWGTTAGKRRARYYQFTAAGRNQLRVEVSQFDRVMGAIDEPAGRTDTAFPAGFRHGLWARVKLPE